MIYTNPASFYPHKIRTQPTSQRGNVLIHWTVCLNLETSIFRWVFLLTFMVSLGCAFVLVSFTWVGDPLDLDLSRPTTCRILACFKLNPFEYLNLPFESSLEDVKKQYRKLSLQVHPDKCKHPQANEAFGALAKAQQLLLDQQERDYILSQVTAAKEELRLKRKKQLKKDNASKIKSLVDEYEQNYEQSEEFQQGLKLKVREILTDQEWRRRKTQMRISEEEGRLKMDEEETKEMWKRKREHEEQWEGTQEQRVSSWRDFMKGGKKVRKGETRPPKLKTEDPNKSYVQRPVKRG